MDSHTMKAAAMKPAPDTLHGKLILEARVGRLEEVAGSLKRLLSELTEQVEYLQSNSDDGEA
jgi:hypothetical protein